MAETIRLPKMDLSMEEGRLVRWIAQAGDTIRKGGIIAEIETDKAIIELEMPNDGTISALLVAEGDVVKVGGAIAETGTEGAAASAPSAAVAPSPDRMRIAISPAARRRARELGIDYATFAGSGPGGRIVYRDFDAAAAAASSGAATAGIPLTDAVAALASTLPGDVRIPLSRMRRTIAKRMQESASLVPVFYLKKTVDVSHPLEIKRFLEERGDEGAKVSLTDFLVSAVARALRAHPGMNASFVGSPYDEESHIVRHEEINVGLAVAANEGLYVPVIHRADKLSIAEIAKLRKEKVNAAQRGSLRKEDLQGGTFTISNLGMFGIDEFQAIVNPPEAGILAVGKVVETPARGEDGTIRFVPTATLTGTFDHRTVDGADAAAFMRALAQALESSKWHLI